MKTHLSFFNHTTLKTVLLTLLLSVIISVGKAYAVDFTAAQIASGASSGHISVSSSYSNSNKKLCSSQSSVAAVSIANSANGDYNANYIEIQADEGYTISTLSLLEKANGTTVGTAAVVFWSGVAGATYTSYATFTMPSNGTTDCDGTTAISVPSGTRTVRLYRGPKLNTSTKTFSGSGTQIGGTSTFNVFSLSATAAASCSIDITPSLSYSPASILIGGTATPSVTGNTGSGAVSYEITSASPTGCATINASTGVVTGVAEGSITVKATIEASGDYCSGTATCNITISDIPCVAPSSVSISGTQNYTEEQTISLSAAYTDGTGSPSYQWYKGGTATENIISGATSATFTKASCLPSDAGDYYCKVTLGADCSLFNSAPYSVTVTALPISAEPTITTQPAGATYEAGETVVPLSVVASGSGTLTYQWQKDGADISGETSSTYTPVASGTYACKVTNTETGAKPTTITSDDAVIVIKSNKYILQGISGTSGTGTLTGDFYTTATTMATVTSTTYDGVAYTKALQFAGGTTSWSNMSYQDKMIRYDCKSTQTTFTIIVRNTGSSAINLYIGDIKENAIGTANSVSSLQSYSIAGGSSDTKTYTITNANVTPASLYITVGDKKLEIVQIIAEEKGTLLPTPGSVGYKLNFNLARPVIRSGGTGWIDDPDFAFCPNSNAIAGTSTYIQLATSGTNYFKFRTDKHAIVKLGVSKKNAFIISDDKSGNVNPIIFPKRSSDDETIFTVHLNTGEHYVVPSGSNIQLTSFQITSAIKINYNANGGMGTMPSQVVAAGTVRLSEGLFIKPGHQLYGWSLTPDGPAVAVDKGELDVAASPDEITLYAVWLEACDAIPTLKQITPSMTIKDNKYVDMAVANVICDYDTTEVHYSIASVSPAIPGLTFKYYYSQIHVEGTPAVNNASVQTRTVTITMQNDCDPAHTYTIQQEFRIIPKTQKSRIAFIVTGSEGGDFTAYKSSDATSSNALLTYLRGSYCNYQVDVINGYATKDSATLADFYKDYDLLIVTDYLETPKGYTNALGTLVDKKPILNFEAYVASGGNRGENWHIHSIPGDPSPKTGTMKVLCAGHAIFRDAEGVEVFNKPGGVSDTTITVLGSISGKGLQGYEIYEAPDFQFIATVENGTNNPLIVCCERQEVFSARLIMYCINYNDMNNLSPAGRVVMHQMIEYLLETDETKVADCSLVFDNGAANDSYNETAYHAAGGTGSKGDGLWSTAANWKPGYNIVPTPYHGTRIVAECHVNSPDAHAGSVKVNKGKDENGNEIQGKLIIEPTGGLLVAGKVTKVFDTRVASPMVTRVEDVLIKADASNNGALVYSNKESEVNATVQYYSRGCNATTNPVWQYIGTPFQINKTALGQFRDAWMCKWVTGATSGLGGLWQWVLNEELLIPFEGYCITQEGTKTYEFGGKLNPPVTTTISLDDRDNEGYAFAANSWTAPIKIQELRDTNFVNAEQAIYIYHSGSYGDWNAAGAGAAISAKTGSAVHTPGQYAVIPIYSSPYLAGADSVIPSMQGFFVKTTDAGAQLTLEYNRVVYDSKYFRTSTQPMRAPARRGVQTTDDKPEVMQLFLYSHSTADRVYLLSRSDFSDDFENGWDGRKIEGDPIAPKLSVVKNGGDMAVAAIPTFEERYLSFRGRQDSSYTFSFDYDGEPIYLYDQVAQQATLIQTGNSYSFDVNNSSEVQRFLITKNPPLIPSDIEVVASDDAFHIENFAREQVDINIFDVQGRIVYRLQTRDEIIDLAPVLPVGVYMARIKAGDTVKVVKLIGKEGAL